MKRIASALCLPKELREEFINVSWYRNHISAFILAVIGAFIQVFNIFRVLVLSKSGLTTLNNIIYFSFYLVMLVICITYLVSQIWLRKDRYKSYLFDSVNILLFVLWNLGLNIYDTYSAESIKISVIIICLMAYATLFIYKPGYMLSILFISYFVMITSTARFYEPGSLINVTIALMFSCIISVNRFFNIICNIKQKQNIKDINKVLKEEEERFKLTCEQYDMLLKYTNDILFVWDLDKNLIKFSDNWHDLFGFPIRINNFTDWIKGNENFVEKKHNDISNMLARLKKGELHYESEVLIKNLSDIKAWYKMKVINQFDKNGYSRFCMGILNDITPQQKTIIELEHEIRKDPLTGVLNKTAFELRVNKILKSETNLEKAVLIVLDLDDFKNINDKFGHPCGDYVLKETAYILTNSFDKEAEIGRIGGDEFAIFLKNISDKMLYETAIWIIESMDKIYWQGEKINTSCSMGAVYLKKEINEYTQLYYEADDAMYTAKKLGKGRIYLAIDK